MPSIALLYDHPRWEEKAILQALKDIGADARLLHVETTPLRIGEPCCPIDLALERSVSFSNAVSTAFAVESWGVKVLNPGTVIYLAGDKVATLSLLASHRVPVPETTVLSGSNRINGSLPPGPPWVVKPVIGSWGRMVARARDLEELEQLLSYKEAARGLYSRIHLVQEYIEKPGRDIRVFTLGDRVVAAIYRVSSHWITNTSRGARAEPAPVTGEIEDLALRAAEALGGGFLGVDLLEDPERGLLVNEVNAVPEFKNTVRVTGVRVHMEVAGYAVEEARR